MSRYTAGFVLVAGLMVVAFGIPVQCCGLCKFAENVNSNSMEAIWCFHGDSVEIKREIQPGEFFPITRIKLDGADLDQMEAEEFGHVWMDRLVGFHDVCDQFEANNAET